MSVHRRRRLVAAAAVAVVLLLGLAVRARLDAEPPAEGAAALVPADALVYVHLSSDRDRDEDAELLSRLRRLPSFARLGGALERTFSSAGTFDLERDVRPWLGDEVALALLDSGTPAARSLVLAAVEDRPRAEGVLQRAAGARPGSEYRGVAVRRFGGVAAAFAGGFLAIGQEPSVRAAIDRAQGRGATLADARPYRRATVGRPEARVMDLYASPDGVRRVLGAQPGALGAIGRALQSPGLEGVSLSAAPEGDDVVAVFARQVGVTGPAFLPRLDAPKTAIGFLALQGLDPLAAVTPLDLGPLIRTLRGEVALSVVPGLPLPTVTLVARVRDEARARTALAETLGGLAEERTEDTVATFEERDGTFVLTLPNGLEVHSTVAEGRVFLASSAPALRRARRGERGLKGSERFRAVVTDVKGEVGAVTFLDLSQLLALGDQAGLTSSAVLGTVRDDLRRIRAFGAVARREENDTTAELRFQIP